MLAFPGVYILSCPNEEGDIEYRVNIIEKFEDLYDNADDLITEKLNHDLAKEIWLDSKVFTDPMAVLKMAKKLESQRKILKGTTTFVESHNLILSYLKV